jgi:hypothetical protein
MFATILTFAATAFIMIEVVGFIADSIRMVIEDARNGE